MNRSERKRKTRTRSTKRRRVTPKRSLIMSVRKQIRHLKPEMKCFDITYGSLGFTTPAMTTATFAYAVGGALLTANQTGGITCLNLIEQESRVNNRIGNKIQVRSISLRLVGGYDGDSFTRVMLVLDKAPNSAALVKGDLFQDNTSLLAPIKIGNRDRFKVIADRLYNTCVTGQTSFYCKLYYRCNIGCNYVSSGGVIADIISNAFYLIAFSDVTNHVVIPYYNVRIRYYDI